MYSVKDTAKAVGFPIQKFSDQSLLATPRNFSQPITSFIASYRQGIHQMPFVYLLLYVLIIRLPKLNLVLLKNTSIIFITKIFARLDIFDNQFLY